MYYIWIVLLNMSKNNFKKPSTITLFSSLWIIVYIWCLPILSKLGFAVENEHSISGFISNAPSTGAMAVFSYIPLTLMKEYQSHHSTSEFCFLISYSLTCFQFFYGMFLICTFHYTPPTIHFGVVFMFGISFIVHSMLIIHVVEPNYISRVLLYIGCLSFLSIPYSYNKGLWLWFYECIGLTCLFSFTPLEWILYDDTI